MPSTEVTSRAGAQEFVESIRLAEAAPEAMKGRRFKALLIKAGWSLNDRFYSEAMLRRDGPTAFPRGSQMRGNHPNAQDRESRPEGSIHDVLSETTSVPRWDATLGGLVAEVEVFPQHADLLNERFAKAIGLSIRASGTGEYGEVDGRKGLIIESLSPGGTVDWVTTAGAGGRVLQLVESAPPLHEAHGMAANDLRRALQDAVDAAHEGRCCWAWVADFHDDWVIFDLSGRDVEDGRYRQDYTVDSAGTATLAGDPVRVNTQTAYVPVVTAADATEGAVVAPPDPPAPAAPPVTSQEAFPLPPVVAAPESSAGPVVPVTESPIPTPKEAVPVTTPEPNTGPPPAGGQNPYTIEAVEALKRKAAQQEQDLIETRAQLETTANDRVSRIKAEEALNASLTENARLRATETARSMTAAACTAAGLFECVHPWVASTVVGPEGAFIPLSEAREVDSPALKSRIDSTVDRWKDLVGKILEAAGVDGRVRGLGAPANDEGMTEAQFEESLAKRFATLPGMSEKTAAVAAKGR